MTKAEKLIVELKNALDRLFEEGTIKAPVNVLESAGRARAKARQYFAAKLRKRQLGR